MTIRGKRGFKTGRTHLPVIGVVPARQYAGSGFYVVFGVIIVAGKIFVTHREQLLQFTGVVLVGATFFVLIAIEVPQHGRIFGNGFY